MMTSAVVPTLLAALLLGDPPTPEASGRAYLDALYRDRAAITCGYIEFTVTSEFDPKHKETEGSVRSYKYWFDKDRFRIDLKEVRPNDPANALDARCSLSDGTYRIIDADNANSFVVESTRGFLAGKPPRGLLLEPFDPRLFGVACTSFGVLHHERLEQLKPTTPGVLIASGLGQAIDTGARALVRNPNGSSVAYFTSDAVRLPTRLITRSFTNFDDGRPMPRTRDEVDSVVVAWPNARGERFDFPKSLKARRIVEEEVVSAESVAVSVANFNAPVDPADLTWKALRPALDAPLFLDGRLLESIRWDGDSFRATEAARDAATKAIGASGPLDPVEEVVYAPYLRRSAFGIGATSALIGLACVALKIRQKKHPA